MAKIIKAYDNSAHTIISEEGTFKMKLHTVLLLLLVLSVSLLTAGCGKERVQVQIPPKAPVGDIKTIAVLPFENFTTDSSLAYEVERYIIQEIVNSGWYEMVDHQRVIDILNQYGYSPKSLSTNVVEKVKSDLKVDAVIFGTVATYFEDVYMSPVYCFNCDKPDKPFYWSTTQNTYVLVEFDAQMINVSNGRVIHQMRASGDAWNYSSLSLGSHSREIPPESPPTNKQQVPITRNAAIDRAAKAFVEDILPTYEWRTVEEIDATPEAVILR